MASWLMLLQTNGGNQLPLMETPVWRGQAGTSLFVKTENKAQTHGIAIGCT
jgi:hypothetical protein